MDSENFWGYFRRDGPGNFWGYSRREAPGGIFEVFQGGWGWGGCPRQVARPGTSEGALLGEGAKQQVVPD